MTEQEYVWLVRPNYPHLPFALVRVPADGWRDRYEPGGFRLATEAEIARWLEREGR